MSLNIELYKKLYLIRVAEEAIVRHYSENDMKTPMHMSMGEEAIVAGVCHALTDDDHVLGTYRSHGLFLAKTQDTDAFFSEMYGKKDGTAGGKSGSMHLSLPEKGMLVSSAIVGSSISTAVGVALSNKMQNNNKTTAVFFGDGATDTGTFWESLNFACLKRLPIIFIMENNKLAVHTSIEKRHGFESITDVVSQYNCTVHEDDTTDVELIYKKTSKIIDDMKKYQRPAFMNLSYYRYLEHVGINQDFDDNYRLKSEFDAWYKVDSINYQREKILKNNCISEDNLSKIESRILKKVQSSVNKAKKSTFAGVESIYSDIYL